MATIDIKIKSYDELTFEITKLNTDLYLKNIEIQRLNNIIDELEKIFEKEIKEGRPKDHLWLMGYYDASKDYLKKLKELKEGKE